MKKFIQNEITKLNKRITDNNNLLCNEYQKRKYSQPIFDVDKYTDLVLNADTTVIIKSKLNDNTSFEMKRWIMKFKNATVENIYNAFDETGIKVSGGYVLLHSADNRILSDQSLKYGAYKIIGKLNVLFEYAIVLYILKKSDYIDTVSIPLNKISFEKFVNTEYTFGGCQSDNNIENLIYN